MLKITFLNLRQTFQSLKVIELCQSSNMKCLTSDLSDSPLPERRSKSDEVQMSGK